jgi:hypothetical protein
MSAEKKVYSLLRLSWNEKNIKSFLSGALSGKEKMSALSALPAISKVVFNYNFYVFLFISEIIYFSLFFLLLLFFVRV